MQDEVGTIVTYFLIVLFFFIIFYNKYLTALYIFYIAKYFKSFKT